MHPWLFIFIGLGLGRECDEEASQASKWKWVCVCVAEKCCRNSDCPCVWGWSRRGRNYSLA